MEIQGKENQLIRIVDERLKQGPEEQVTDAAINISAIREVDQDAAWNKVLARIDVSRRLGIFFEYMIRTAAVLFIPLLVGSVYFFIRQQNRNLPSGVALQEITSPIGVRSQIVLPDGSMAWLNAESTIRFPVPFNPKKRVVELQGEAFFDVSENPSVPFEVHTEYIRVLVTGTQFNVKSFGEDDAVEVVLKDGRVCLGTGKQGAENSAAMNPGERAVFLKETGKLAVKKEKIDKYIAWQQGKLVFDETPMTEVAEKLERWYGVDVEVNDPEVRRYRINTTFDNNPLHQVLELLALSSPIDIRYIPATIDENKQIKSLAKIIIKKKK
jgi:ferric-dicitrate binding protein FerR (iron transport regulator)